MVHSAYVDEHVEARYEEIINHLHKALSSTEQDEQEFKVIGVVPRCRVQLHVLFAASQRFGAMCATVRRMF